VSDQQRPSPSRPQRAANRFFPVLSLVAFFLPFATVKGCNSDRVEEYTGFELLGRTGSEGLFLVIGIALLLFGLSFLRPRATVIARGIVQSTKALVCAFAGFLALVSTGLMFMFDKLEERSGLLLALFCWWTLYALSLGLAFQHLAEARGRAPLSSRIAGYGLGALLPWIQFWTLGRDDPPDAQVVWDTLAMLVFVVPVVLLGWFAVLWWRRRRAAYST
jgi:hypothetical protein